MRAYRLAALSIGLIAASGCGNSSAPAPVTPNPTTLVRPGGPNGPGGPGGAPPALVGTWVTNCLPNPLLSEKDFYREQYIFTPNETFTHTRAAFAESTCGTEPTLNEVTSGTFQIGKKIQAYYARMNETKTRFNNLDGDATGIEFVITLPASPDTSPASPEDSAGNAYSVFGFYGQSLFLGVLPYDDHPIDRGKSSSPALDVSKEFHRIQ